MNNVNGCHSTDSQHHFQLKADMTNLGINLKLSTFLYHLGLSIYEHSVIFWIKIRK